MRAHPHVRLCASTLSVCLCAQDSSLRRGLWRQWALLSRVHTCGVFPAECLLPAFFACITLSLVATVVLVDGGSSPVPLWLPNLPAMACLALAAWVWLVGGLVRCATTSDPTSAVHNLRSRVMELAPGPVKVRGTREPLPPPAPAFALHPSTVCPRVWVAGLEFRRPVRQGSFQVCPCVCWHLDHVTRPLPCPTGCRCLVGIRVAFVPPSLGPAPPPSPTSPHLP
jgi:hypothetical protein